MREFLAEVRGDYDVILIDNPPSLQLHNWAAMLAADYLLIPRPARRFFEHVPLAGPGSRPDGAGRAEPPSADARGSSSQWFNRGWPSTWPMRRCSGTNTAPAVFETRIPIASDIKEAIAKGCPITNYKPKGASAKVFRALADEMLGRIESLTRTEAA